jgi:antitoxin component of RelBE/YafQ-DinJ toxin-antitoxin module
MSTKTIIQTDLDESIKARAISVLKAQGLSLEDFAQEVLNTALKRVATEKNLDTRFFRPAETGEPATEASAHAEAELMELKKLPGFGMWADRADMENPAAWVRNLRKPRFQDDL